MPGTCLHLAYGHLQTCCLLLGHLVTLDGKVYPLTQRGCPVLEVVAIRFQRLLAEGGAAKQNRGC